MGTKKRLYLLLVLIFLVFLIGSTGYYTLFGQQYRIIDYVYMTVISLTSVGYGEVIEISGNAKAQIFTMFLITFGMGVIVYSLSTLTALLIEGDLTGMLRKKNMEKQIKKLKNHYIVCGGGQTGRPLLEELSKNRERFVLIEKNQKKIDAFDTGNGLLFINGDATEDRILISAGIKKAAGIVISLPSDKDNLYITMTARMLKNDIRIISRMTDPQLEEKFKKAGADGAVSPNTIGALRMASEMIRPTVVDFLDTMLRSKQGNLRIHEINISEASSIEGKKISDSNLKDKFGLLILGLRRASGEIQFNPSPAQELTKGMTLIVMGEVDKIADARNT